MFPASHRRGEILLPSPVPSRKEDVPHCTISGPGLSFAFSSIVFGQAVDCFPGMFLPGTQNTYLFSFLCVSLQVFFR